VILDSSAVAQHAYIVRFNGSQHPIQRLISGTGLQLTTPLNPLSLSPLTHSIQSATGLNRRYDYILPNALLFSNIQSSQVFRTDLLNPVPSNLNTNDDIVASDHLPVLMMFYNPFAQPFSLTSIIRSNQNLALTWQSVPGQSYRVESSSVLATGWVTFADNLLATSFDTRLSTNVPASSELFRVKRMD
jgi:hypothetical protein